MKVLVFGSRDWVNQGPIERELSKLPPGTVIVHGACRGADNIAGYVAEKLGFQVRVYPAQWELHGKRAGSLRNQAMLDGEHPSKDGTKLDFAIVFHKDLRLGLGSHDMKNRLDAAGVRVDIHLR